MFDAAVAGELKAMYIFGEDVAQTDPDTAHVAARAREPRVPRLPGDLRERDDEVRRRDPARLGLPREGRHVHQRRAPLPARRAGDRPARRRARPTSRSSTTVSPRARPRDGLGDPVGRARRDRPADAPLRRRQPRAARPERPAVAGRTRRHRLADPLRHRFDRPGGRGHFAALPYKAPGDARRRGVPADPRHRPPPRSTTTPAR